MMGDDEKAVEYEGDNEVDGADDVYRLTASNENECIKRQFLSWSYYLYIWSWIVRFKKSYGMNYYY